jgi:hypothetical protein
VRCNPAYQGGKSFHALPPGPWPIPMSSTGFRFFSIDAGDHGFSSIYQVFRPNILIKDIPVKFIAPADRHSCTTAPAIPPKKTSNDSSGPPSKNSIPFRATNANSSASSTEKNSTAWAPTRTPSSPSPPYPALSSAVHWARQVPPTKVPARSSSNTP